MERDSKAVGEFCSKFVKIQLHYEYIACYVLPGMQQTWPGMSAGIGLTMRIPNINNKYATAFYQKGYFLEFAVDFEGFTYNSLRVPSDMAMDIGKRLMAQNAQKFLSLHFSLV